MLRLEDRWATAKAQNQLLIQKKHPFVDKDSEEDLDVEWAVDEDLEITNMPRPQKRRRVRGRPNSSYFKPAGIRMIDLVDTSLSLPEFEAIRLIDFEKISQKDAGNKMQVSQSTLSRILSSGRGKIADAIINGKAIKIEK